jgi:hypothetical protein
LKPALAFLKRCSSYISYSIGEIAKIHHSLDL